MPLPQPSVGPARSHWHGWYGQAGSGLLGAEVAMPFVDGTRLLAETDMRGATGNDYVGFMEFEDMPFVLHLLREGDQFLEVGTKAGV